jgi:hypothetical protein
MLFLCGVIVAFAIIDPIGTFVTGSALALLISVGIILCYFIWQL